MMSRTPEILNVTGEQRHILIGESVAMAKGGKFNKGWLLSAARLRSNGKTAMSWFSVEFAHDGFDSLIM